MTTIRYKTVPTNLTKGEVPLNRYVVLHNGTVYDDTVYSGVSQKSGQPTPLVRATGEMILSEIANHLRHGYRVELPDVSAFLTMPGSVESKSAESRRTMPADLVAHFVAKGSLKKCCQGADVALENVTHGAQVGITGVIDGISMTPNTLTKGTNVEVHTTGYGLFIPDPNDPTVGAYLADMDGRLLVKATVIESTATTLICVFPQIDLPAGTYKFCVGSRNGLDPAQYGVTIGKRNVTVVDAAGEGEGV